MPTTINNNQYADQLQDILDDYNALKQKSRYDDISDLGLIDAHRLITKARAAIERISGIDSAYSKQFQIALNSEHSHTYEKLMMIIGIVNSLLSDIHSGYLSTIAELLHGEIFADFLEMAEYLNAEGYKDAAAVICGGVLETHLRQLCMKNSIDVNVNTAHSVKPKGGNDMNLNLTTKGIYTKLFQKSITAWLDIRNNAAHAHYDGYTKDQVSFMVVGVRDFIIHHPA